MTRESLKYGEEAETFALSFLKKKGYDILERNFKTRFGEIDLVARDNNTIVFIEVKARKSPLFGGPAGALTAVKKARLGRLAAFYLKTKGHAGKARFDVVLITGGLDAPVVDLIQNAFDTDFPG